MWDNFFVLTTRSVVLNMKTQTSSCLKWMCCSAPEITCVHVLWSFPGFDDFHLSIHSDMATVAKAMACPESGLEVRDRMWLKITIANAFIGMSLKAQDMVEHLLFPSSVCTHSYIPHLLITVSSDVAEVMPSSLLYRFRGFYCLIEFLVFYEELNIIIPIVCQCNFSFIVPSCMSLSCW